MKNLANVQKNTFNPIVFEPQIIEEALNIQPTVEEPTKDSNN